MNTPLLQARNVKIWLGLKNHQKIIEIKEWEVHQNEVWLVVGGNGSGKTTLLRAITGLIPTIFRGRVEGTLRLFGKDPAKEFPSVFERVALLFQNPYDQLTQATVQGEIDFPLENIGYPRAKGIERRERVIEQFGLQEKKSQHPASLSTGEGQRVLIASIAARDSTLICLDEPLSFIDSVERKKVLKWINEYRNQKKAFVIATHRLEEYVSLKPKLFLLYNGQGLVFDNVEAFLDKVNWSQIYRLSLITQYNYLRRKNGKLLSWDLAPKLKHQW